MWEELIGFFKSWNYFWYVDDQNYWTKCGRWWDLLLLARNSWFKELVRKSSIHCVIIYKRIQTTTSVSSVVDSHNLLLRTRAAKFDLGRIRSEFALSCMQYLVTLHRTRKVRDFSRGNEWDIENMPYQNLRFSILQGS